MAACKLRKGDRIYECRYHEATLTELVTDPELVVQGGNSHFWHWKAKVVETNSRIVTPGDMIEYGITEEAPQYGPQLFRKNLYEVGYKDAEPVLPPFDTGNDDNKRDMNEKKDYNECHSFQECVDELVRRVMNRVEEEMPVQGDFFDIVEVFGNPDVRTSDVVGSYGLRVFKMPSDIVPDPKKRYVQACAYIPSGEYKATLMAGSGTKAEILSLMKEQSYAINLNGTFGELLDMLKDF